MPNQVGFPVESLGTLVTLVLPLLGVDYHVLLQAGEERDTLTSMAGMDWTHMEGGHC